MKICGINSKEMQQKEKEEKEVEGKEIVQNEKKKRWKERGGAERERRIEAKCDKAEREGTKIGVNDGSEREAEKRRARKDGLKGDGRVRKGGREQIAEDGGKSHTGEKERRYFNILVKKRRNEAR